MFTIPDHHKRMIQNLSLRTKMLIISLLAIISISMSAFLGLHYLNHVYNRQLYRVVAGNLAISSSTISERLKNIETLSYVIMSSVTIQNALTDVQEQEDAKVHSNSNRAINNALATYKQTFTIPGLKGISLYNDSFVNTSNLALLNKHAKPVEKAISEGRRAHGGIVWSMDPDDPGYLLLTREVRKIEKLSLKHLGDLVIFVDLGQLVQDANHGVTSYEHSIYSLFKEKELVYSSMALPPEMTKALYSIEPNAYSILTIRGHRYFAVHDRIPDFSLDYINLVPYDQITSTIYSIERWIILVLLMVIVIAIIFTAELIRFTLSDMNRLIVRMDHFSKAPEQSLPESAIHYEHRRDELGRLHQQFEAMAEQIQHLINVNYVTQLLNKDAKLHALESQINPHFLYNTLDTINWRAKALKDTSISDMTEALGTLLRVTLGNKKSLVPLSYELHLVHSYITIQNIRFEDRLVYHEEVDDTLQRAMVPQLSIQPLLENAIRYGMEEMMEACNVTLVIRRVASMLIIEVKNEGSQFPSNLLEKLQNGQVSPHGHGIGLLNIQQRIQILFGEDYGLSFHNDGDFAVATISIPYTETTVEDIAC